MLVSSDIEVLEHWLQVDSLDLDSLSVFSKNVVDLSNFILIHIEVLLSCKSSIFDSYWSNCCLWNFLDSISGEGRVDVCAELNVIEHLLWIVGLVFLSKGIKLLESQVEVQHGENRLELGFGNFSFSQLVEVVEKLFDSNSLHNDVMLESRFNIAWVVGDFNSLLHVSVVNDIKALSSSIKESRASIS